MFFVLTEHVCNPGFREAASKRISDNGEAMAAQPGFSARYLLRPVEPIAELVSFTVWESEGAYRDWLTARDRLPGSAEARRYYASVTNRIYTDWAVGDEP